MRTTFDQEDILYSILATSAVKAALSGGIYKQIRPDDSKLEDVVINSLPIDQGSVQRSTANVNVYVPDIQIKINGKNQYQPNTTRLKTLTALIVPALQERYSSEKWNFWISNQTTFREPEINQHYLNLRIEFKFHNS